MPYVAMKDCVLFAHEVQNEWTGEAIIYYTDASGKQRRQKVWQSCIFDELGQAVEHALQSAVDDLEKACAKRNFALRRFEMAKALAEKMDGECDSRIDAIRRSIKSARDAASIPTIHKQLDALK